MDRRKIKLELRITLLIVVLSFLFIFVFTYIQLNNEIYKLTAYNKYRARVGTMIVKTSLEVLLKGPNDKEAMPGLFEAAIESFSGEGVVEKMSVIAMDGSVLATNDPLIKEFGEAGKDIERYSSLSRTTGKDNWFYSSVNEKTMMIDIYIPLFVEPSYQYIVKLSFSKGNIRDAMMNIIVPIGLTIIVVIIGNLLLGILLYRTVAEPIKVLNSATKDIAAGNLNLKVTISTRDEIEELGDTFNEMTVALKKMKERAENANPLTKLPGNTSIRAEVEERIKNGNKFTVIHADLTSFKAYNDRYGIARGDDVIKFTGMVIGNAVAAAGDKDGFLGHEGGDNFIIIVTPDKATAVANKIIAEFDAGIKDFYSKEDVEAGYISEQDRRGMLVRYPIMSISLAGVTNETYPIASYGELTNIAVGAKRMVKMIPKSNFLLDRRRPAG